MNETNKATANVIVEGVIQDLSRKTSRKYQRSRERKYFGEEISIAVIVTRVAFDQG